MKKAVIITSILLVLLIITYFLVNTNKSSADPRGDAYAGSKTCIKCHSNIYNSYLHTAHYIASVPASDMYVHGSFAKNFNVVNFSPSQKVVMEKRDSGMFQTFYLNGKATESQRFDIVLGGVKGESYLFWKGNGLNQLPISYFTQDHKWMLSPRFAPGYVNFNRTITSRCLECHASYVNDLDNKARQLTAAEQFDKNSLIYSIDCERCHGPGAQHAAFQTENPEIKFARFIASYKSLSRTQKIDMCGQCHSGNKSQMLRSTFGFKPGDTLAKFKLRDFVSAIDTGKLDVHGNQVQLLESSKCFINSKMDCATCHNVHQNERGNFAIFTQKCLNCHSDANHNYCKMADKLSAQFIKSNCIQCHMPALTSAAIIASNTAKSATAEISVYTHHIAIYPDQVKKVLAFVNK